MSDEHRIVMVDKEVAELIERLQKDLDRNANMLDEATEWMGRLAPAVAAMRAQLTEATALLQAAEAQIVAVRQSAEKTMTEARKEKPGAQFSAVLADGFVRIRGLLTPATTPGAGFRALVDKVGDSADDVTVFATSKPPSPGAGEGTKCGVTAWNRWSLPCDREPGHTGTHSHDPTPGRSGK